MSFFTKTKAKKDTGDSAHQKNPPSASKFSISTLLGKSKKTDASPVTPAKQLPILSEIESNKPERLPSIHVPPPQVSPVFDWLHSHCLMQDLARSRRLRNIKGCASTWWNRGIIGAEMETPTRNVILDWAKSVDSLCKCAGVASTSTLPTSLWTLPDWAIDTFPTKQVFMSVQSHVERHFGLKLDNTINYTVAGILNSEKCISSSGRLSEDTESPGTPDSNDPIHSGDWVHTPHPPFTNPKQGLCELSKPNEASVRIYLCVYAGKSISDYLKFQDTRSLKSKENTPQVGGELPMEPPSWFNVISWSDHKCLVKLPPGGAELDEANKFWMIALDATKLKRTVNFSDVDLLECEQLVRETGYGNTPSFQDQHFHNFTLIGSTFHMNMSSLSSLFCCCDFPDFQLYLGKIEGRRRERLSCYEEAKMSAGTLKPSAMSPHEVTSLIKEGKVKMTRNSDASPRDPELDAILSRMDDKHEEAQTRQYEDGDNEEDEEEEDEEIGNSKFAQMKSDKIRGRTNTKFSKLVAELDEDEPETETNPTQTEEMPWP